MYHVLTTHRRLLATHRLLTTHRLPATHRLLTRHRVPATYLYRVLTSGPLPEVPGGGTRDRCCRGAAPISHFPGEAAFGNRPDACGRERRQPPERPAAASRSGRPDAGPASIHPGGRLRDSARSGRGNRAGSCGGERSPPLGRLPGSRGADQPSSVRAGPRGRGDPTACRRRRLGGRRPGDRVARPCRRGCAVRVVAGDLPLAAAGAGGRGGRAAGGGGRVPDARLGADRSYLWRPAHGAPGLDLPARAPRLDPVGAARPDVRDLAPRPAVVRGQQNAQVARRHRRPIRRRLRRCAVRAGPGGSAAEDGGFGLLKVRRLLNVRAAQTSEPHKRQSRTGGGIGGTAVVRLGAVPVMTRASDCVRRIVSPAPIRHAPSTRSTTPSTDLSTTRLASGYSSTRTPATTETTPEAIRQPRAAPRAKAMPWTTRITPPTTHVTPMSSPSTSRVCSGERRQRSPTRIESVPRTHGRARPPVAGASAKAPTS